MPDPAVVAAPGPTTEGGPGLYGKLPARGDFLTRRLSRGFVDAYDGWVQAALEASREQLGERWLETYLTSPIWRFVLSAGVAGDAAMLGVMIPSVDSAGRYFPFTIAASLATLASQDKAVTPQLEDVLRGALDDWLAEAERLALLGLGEQLDLDAYDAAVAAIAPPPAAALAGPTPTLLGEPAATARNAWRFGGAGGAAVSHVAPEMLASLLERAVGRYSLWWTEGSQAMAPSRLACEGLPAAERFVAMLDGGYATRGWQDRPSPLLETPAQAAQAAPAQPPAEPAESAESAAHGEREDEDDGSDTVVNDNTDTVRVKPPASGTDEAADDAASAASRSDELAGETDADSDPWTIPAPKARKRAEDDTAPQPPRDGAG